VHLSCDIGDMEIRNAPPELLEAEYEVPKINWRIDEQRRLIEELSIEGDDITSAKIVLDSLLMSLCLWVRERERLRSIPNGASTEADAA
jgi:hypothetical protein